MTADLTCRSCDGRGNDWGTWWTAGMPDPCPTCDGTGRIDLHAAALHVARAHGTRPAVDWSLIITLDDGRRIARRMP